MRSATSAPRSVMITRSLCPRSSRACCASCTLIVPSSPKLTLLGREHSNWTSCAQRIGNPKIEPPQKFSFWTFYTANGEIKRDSTNGSAIMWVKGIAMPSPFPGMDPYLETPDRWRNVHSNLATEIQTQLAPLIRPRYYADQEPRFVYDTGLDVVTRHQALPDVSVVEHPRPTTLSRGAAAIAPAPLEVLITA